MVKLSTFLIMLMFVFGQLSAQQQLPQTTSNLRFVPNKGQWAEIMDYSARTSAGDIELRKDRFHFVFINNDLYSDHHADEPRTISGHAFEIHFLNTNPNVSYTQSNPDSHNINYFLGNDPAHWVSGLKQYQQVTYHELWEGIDMEVLGVGENMKFNFIVKPGANPDKIKYEYIGVDDIALKNGSIQVHTSAVDVMEPKPYTYQQFENQQIEVKSKYIFNEGVISFELPKGYDTSKDLVIDPTLVFSSYTGSTADNWGHTATYDTAGNLYGGGRVFEYRSAYSPGSGTGLYSLVGAFDGSFNGGDEDIAISKFSATGSTLLYSTYLGGNADDKPHSLVVNANNELYVMGSSNSTNYPTSSGAYDATSNGGNDIVLTRFNTSGSALLGSTYVGGSSDDGYYPSSLAYNYEDEVRGEIVLDASSTVYVASYTRSSNFPVTSGVFQGSRNGSQDGVLFKMNRNLSSMIASTYIGGSGEDAAYSLELDNAGNIYATGGTNSSNFPTSSGSYRASAFGGEDGWIVKMNNSLSSRIAGTYIGTSAYDQSYLIELDKTDNICVYGQSLGAYPVSSGVYATSGARQFIHCLNNNLTSTVFSTVFGSPSSSTINISPTAFLLDRCDNIYCAGWGGNVNAGAAGGNTYGMPITSDAYKSSTDGSDFYFIVLQPRAIGLLYATYFGASGTSLSGEHVDGGTSRFDPEGIIYEAVCAGCGASSLFPTTPGAWSNTNNSANCNLGVIKFAFDLAGTNVDVNAVPRTTGCVPLTVNFTSIRTHVTSVHWDFGDGSTSTVFNPTHTYTDTGRFVVQLIGYDPASCNGSDTAYIDVWVRDDSITANFADEVLIDCYNRTFSAKADNFPTTTYLWNMGDGTTYTTDSVFHTYASPGTYTVSLQVNDPNSCNGTSSFSMPITIKPLVYLNVASTDTSGCAPLRVVFNNSSASTGDFLWDFGDGTFSSAKSPTHIYTEAGNFPVTLYMNDPSTCNVTDTFKTNVVVFDDTIKPISSITRTFYGCDSVGVRVIGFNPEADSIRWYFGDGTSSNNFDNYHIYRDSGYYTIVYVVYDASQICEPVDSVVDYVSLNPLDATFDVSDTVGCTPLAVNFKNLSGFPDVEAYWYFGDGDSAYGTRLTHTYEDVGIYTVTHIAIDSNVCNFADTAYISIRTKNDSTQAYFSENILSQCDSNLTIQFTNTSIDAVQYEWYFGDRTKSTEENPLHTWTLPGTYQVMMVAIDSSKCHPRDTAIKYFTLKPNAVAHFEIIPLSCTGEEIFTHNLSDTNSVFTWSFGNEGVSYIAYDTFYTYLTAGTYTITLIIEDTTTCDVYDTAYQQIEVLPEPIALFSVEKDTFYYLDEIDFTNLSEHYTDLLWNFGDGDTSTVIHPSHVYEGIHDFTPCITVWIAQTASCIDTFCLNIFIDYDPIIGVPNAFSPNGDGLNDRVKVEGLGITELQFRIFNRWGEQVYFGTDKNEGWDGYYKGHLQEMDVYVYSVEAKFLDGTFKKLSGNITLVQ